MKQFVCRLWEVQMPDGRTLLTYTEPTAHALTMCANRVVSPPDIPMNGEELTAWMQANATGFVFSGLARPNDLPPVSVIEVSDGEEGVPIALAEELLLSEALSSRRCPTRHWVPAAEVPAEVGQSREPMQTDQPTRSGPCLGGPAVESA